MAFVTLSESLLAPAPIGSGRTTASGTPQTEGYKDSVPEFDWSLTFVLQDGEWNSAAKRPGKRTKVFRVSIPARTKRHKQAAIQTQWPNGKNVLYGFRKVAEQWICVAASDEELRGPINLNS